LEKALVEDLREQLESLKPMPAVFSHNYVKRLNGTNIKEGRNKMELAEALMADIAKFKEEKGCERLVIVWAASTEIFLETSAIHESIEAFEKAMYDNDENIAPSMIYAYAAIKSGVPFANGAPNLTVDIPALADLAARNGVPICGKDFKTKEESKLSVLETILQPEQHPDLYGHFSHVVRINYYPPRGDNKEGWDAIDIFGWLGYKMQIKIDFMCRDSILAAPLVLDLALFMDLAQRAGMKGVQEWLSFYFKAPQTPENLYPEHDIFIQLKKLKNTLRHLMGEELITHLGLDYYEEN
jgi:myo-inositol-1-phosphate synthase